MFWLTARSCEVLCPTTLEVPLQNAVRKGSHASWRTVVLIINYCLAPVIAATGHTFAQFEFEQVPTSSSAAKADAN